MRSNALMGIALGATLVALAGCATANRTATRPQAGGPPGVLTPAPGAGQPWFRPYPEGQGDTEGLSRDPEDGDRGGIGGNPD